MPSGWFRGEARGTSGGRGGEQSGGGRRKVDDRRLRLEALEDRSLLSVSLGVPATAFPPLSNAAALVSTSAAVTRFQIMLPANVPNGVAIPVSVVAFDAQNRPVPSYTGTVNLTSSDTGATLPASVTCKFGVATFQAKFVTGGSQTITATDSVTATLTGSATTNVAVPAVVTRITVLLPPNSPNGVPVPVGLVAVDAQNRPVLSYKGTVNLTCTDTGATLPASVTFKDGRATFQATFATGGPQTIAATDSVTATLTGSATTNVAVPAVATRFTVLLPPNSPNGVPVPVGLTAVDAQNRPVLSYKGTVNLTCTDTGATLPASVTFKDGRATFQATFTTGGPQTITATDSVTATLTGSATTNVAVPAVATHFTLLLPPKIISGTSLQVPLVALDAQNRPVLTYNGVVNLTSSDLTATLPASVTFKNGRVTAQVTFATVGQQTLTATDSANGALVGTASTTVVAAPVATHFALMAPPQVPGGRPVTLFLVALDAQNRPVFNYTGTVTLSSTDPAATLPASVVFKEGRATIQVTFATAGKQSVSATDSVNTALTGTTTTTVIVPTTKK